MNRQTQSSQTPANVLNRRQFLRGGVGLLTALVGSSLLWKTGQAAGVATGIAVPASQSAQIRLPGITHTWQTINNCGPATLAMNFSLYGDVRDQQTIAQVLRPNSADQNVRPDELVSYAQSQGYQAVLRVNGSAAKLRSLLDNGIPVILETWESDDLNNVDDGFAHFRLVVGYDDARQAWIVYDSYFYRDLVNPEGEYQGMVVPYALADQLWRVMNRKYVVIYPAAQAATVQTILADSWDDAAMWQAALSVAEQEQAAAPSDPFAWFNLGSSRYATGQAAEAVQAFQQAQAIGLPTRMFWYQYEPFEALYALGRYAELLALVNANLSTASGLEELYYWQALAFAAIGEPDEAQQALQQALWIKPNYGQALAALEQGLV